MSNRMSRKAQAEETLLLCERGHYVNPAGVTVTFGEALRQAITGTSLFRPDELADLRRQRRELLQAAEKQSTWCEVVNGTTLESAAAAVSAGGSVMALNFASAKNPGGGFLGGSQAQEESLARSSGLYPCINPQQEYYQCNRSCGSCLYTHHLIHSPEVPVVRDDTGRLLERFYCVSMITSPAVNAGALFPDLRPQIRPVMSERIEQVLNVSVLKGHDTLILGAWGCGVFRNDPALIAELFHAHLCGGEFAGAFRRVIFAVLDFTDKDIIQPFRERFA